MSTPALLILFALVFVGGASFGHTSMKALWRIFHIHWYGIVQTQATRTHLIARCRCGAIKQVPR